MRHLIAIFLLLSVINTSAQNYDCLQFGPKKYFINGNNYVRGMRIDSMRTVNSDVIYYPYRTQRIKNYLGGASATIDSLGASWLGSKVLKHPDGTFVFDNMWDTVIIKTQAHTGDSWFFYNDTSVFSYVATLTSEDTITVSGTLDSMKTITITAYKAGVAQPWDPVNNFKLIVCKNFGFVQAFDLYTFPYHRPDTTSFHPLPGIYYIRHFDYYLDVLLGNLGTCDLGCINDTPPDTTNSIFHLFPFYNPTLMETYDFAIGDVYESDFMVYGSSTTTWDHYTLDSVTSKTTSPYNFVYGGVEHTMNIVTDYSHTPPGKTYTYGSNSFSPIADTNLLIHPNHLPEEWNAGYLLHYFPKFFPGSLSCDSPSSYVVDQDFMGGGFGYNGSAYLPSYHFTTYSIGFGISGKYDYNAVSFVTQNQSYIYYHKNATSCGTFVLPDKTSIVSVNTNNNIQIVPNPAIEHIEISTNSTFDDKTIISTYDITGKCIFKSQTAKQQTTFTINTSYWNNGLYMVIVQNNEGIIKKEKVLIHH